MKILVTGAAGFIGSKLMFMLAERGDEVVGLDNINDYYDVRLKYGRLSECGFALPEDGFVFGITYQSLKYANCRFVRMGLEEKAFLDKLFEKEKFDKVVNLAAQAMFDILLQIHMLICGVISAPAKKNFLPMQSGDVHQTNANTTKLETECGYKSHRRLHDGIVEFMKWYKSDKNLLRD